jgi:hypothetical protein
VLYFDTSVILPLFVPEPTSKAVMAFVDGLPADQLTVSQWTMVEFASVLGRHVRGGRIDRVFAAEVTARFDKLAPGTFCILVPDCRRLLPGKAVAGRSRSWSACRGCSSPRYCQKQRCAEALQLRQKHAARSAGSWVWR